MTPAIESRCSPFPTVAGLQCLQHPANLLAKIQSHRELQVALYVDISYAHSLLRFMELCHCFHIAGVLCLIEVFCKAESILRSTYCSWEQSSEQIQFSISIDICKRQFFCHCLSCDTRQILWTISETHRYLITLLSSIEVIWSCETTFWHLSEGANLYSVTQVHSFIHLFTHSPAENNSIAGTPCVFLGQSLFHHAALTCILHNLNGAVRSTPMMLPTDESIGSEWTPLWR
jgi:hypothetical protein